MNLAREVLNNIVCGPLSQQTANAAEHFRDRLVVVQFQQCAYIRTIVEGRIVHRLVVSAMHRHRRVALQVMHVKLRLLMLGCEQRRHP